MGAHKPKLCILGLMWNDNSQFVGQTHRLASLFEKSGFQVAKSTTHKHPLARLLDMLFTVFKKRNAAEMAIFDIFGGASFVLEDIVTLLGKWLGLPFVFILRGGAMPEFIAKHPKWATRVLKRASKIVTPSKFLARALQPYGFHAEVIPNVLPLSEYPFRHRKSLSPRILWMRTFHPIYNPELAIRAFKILVEKYPHAELVMAGGDRDGHEAQMQKLVREYGLEDKVKFAGFLDHRGKLKQAGDADIFINTNRIDNMPVSVVEAAALGLPVVCTNVGGIPDLVTHEKSALLVTDNSPEELAAAMSRLLSDSPLASKISEGGRQVAENSDWPRVLDRWENLFEKVLESRDRARRLGSPPARSLE